MTATSDLSALVKIAQLLVLHFAMHEHQAGQADFPSEKVAELQDRFMVFGSSSPINWILNLRAYGAVIRDNTTAAGWIEWSDDGQKLTYKALDLTLNDLRWAVRDQVSLAQEQLSWLLLLPDSEPDTRARLVPTSTRTLAFPVEMGFGPTFTPIAALSGRTNIASSIFTSNRPNLARA